MDAFLGKVYEVARNRKQTFQRRPRSPDEADGVIVNMIRGGGLGNQIGNVLSGLQYAMRIHRAGHVSILLQHNPSPHKRSNKSDVLQVFPDLPLASHVPTPFVFVHSTIFTKMDLQRAGAVRAPPAGHTAVFQTDVAHMEPRDVDELERLVQQHAVIPALARTLEELVPALSSDADGLRRAAFLHVRRGDYIKIINRIMYGLDLSTYYRQGLALFLSKAGSNIHEAYILVCSDDVPWCQTHLPQLYPEVPAHCWVYQSASCSGVETLSLMARCGQGGILANSSLSWCASVLGQALGANRHLRTYVTPSYFLRCPWPFSPSVSRAARFHPQGTTVLEVGNKDISYEIAAAIAAGTLLVIALAYCLIQAARRRTGA
jgi:hypothetical protein